MPESPENELPKNELPKNELPKNELDALTQTVIDARSLATGGRVLEGYRCLLERLTRALDQQERGQPWGRALATEYSRAMDRYRGEWGLGVE